MFELSDSEELDVLGTEAGEIAENSPLHSPACEELVDVLSRAAVAEVLAQVLASTLGFTIFFLNY